MKKSIVAVGVIAILGIGYVGASWYTGNVIENGIDDKLAQIAEELNDYQQEFDVAIDYSDYQKNLFSTKLHLTINVSPKDSLDDELDQKTVFDDDITIHHGPFPLAALANGKFAPQMAWAEYEMTEKASPELWKLSGNKPFITGYMGMSYQEYLTLKLVNNAINSHDANSNERISKLDVSAGKFSFEGNKDFSNLLIDAHLDAFSYAENEDQVATLNNFTLSAKPNSEKTGIEYQLGLGDFSFTSKSYYSTSNLMMNNIKSQGNVVYANQNIDGQTTIDKITYTPDMRENKKDQTIVINQLAINQKSKLNETNPNTFDGELTSSIASLFFGQQNLGNGSLDFDYQGIDESLLSNNFKSYDLDNSQQLDDNDPINVKISLNKFDWHNAAGNIETSAFFGFSGDRKSMNDFDIDNIDVLKLKIDAPFDVLARIIAQSENPSSNDVTTEQLNKANQSIQMMAAMFLHSSPIVTFTNGETKGIYSDIKYAKENKEVHVNGQVLTKDEFFDSF